MSDIAIIGSDSFIASNFILKNEKNFSLRLFSRKSSGKNDEIILKNLFNITEGHLKDCKCLINFTAIVHKPEIKDKTIYEDINVKLPVHLANVAKKAGIRLFIQMSTIAVYEETEYISEKTNENPSTIYGRSKLKADNQLLKFQDKDFIISIVRPPMVYGGGIAPGNMMKLINAAQRGFPMPFKGIKNERDFINVRNLILALNTIIENGICGIIIPTDKKAISTEEIINYVRKYSNSRVRIIKVPIFILSIIRKFKPDIYNKVFGSLKVTSNIPDTLYKPIFTLEDGIKEMVNLS
ncbi:MAG: hypothetical protein A2041_00395 [Bacteroidetes bacterium GWA2_31_9b]|nr:MAG: hypothetical protein A2041_00395 [Bacteroidetes bacterium GWA2_31_9b]